jgi:splicing factor U2AF 35 kDa subunit
MADYLASIFGTEKDKVNCSFYFKIGACRHGEKCAKLHNRPTFSQTVLLKNLYLSPLNLSQTAAGALVTKDELQRHFDDIFEELFVELEAQYGEIEEMNICDNLSEHLAGNTYVKFRYEEDAEKACQELNNRWFNGKPIYSELSPVTDFHEACCRQYQMGECPRGGFCNFLHLKPISQALRRKLYAARYARRRHRSRSVESFTDEGLYAPYNSVKTSKNNGHDRRSRSRSSRDRSRSRERERDRDRDRDRHRSRKNGRH